jgi:hypothetical protein
MDGTKKPRRSFELKFEGDCDHLPFNSCKSNDAIWERGQRRSQQSIQRQEHVDIPVCLYPPTRLRYVIWIMYSVLNDFILLAKDCLNLLLVPMCAEGEVWELSECDISHCLCLTSPILIHNGATKFCQWPHFEYWIVLIWIYTFSIQRALGLILFVGYMLKNKKYKRVSV